MARIDKTDSAVGIFRAPSAGSDTAYATGDIGKVVGVGFTDGYVEKGPGDSGIVGLFLPRGEDIKGDPIDIMTDGELVDVANLFDTAPAIGSPIFVDATGNVVPGTSAGGEGLVRVGTLVESDRIVVRM